MLDFLVAILWALAVLASFVGYGRLLHAPFRSNPVAISDWLESPVYGLAFTLLVSGYANLVSWAARPFLIGYVLFGAALCLAFMFHDFLRWQPPERTQPHWSFRPFALALTILLILRLAGAVNVPAWGVGFSPSDDLHSYLVSAERMAQIGNVGADPFNCRLMLASLGGDHFLNAMIIAPLPVENVHLLEEGLGILIVALAAAALGMRLKLPPTASASLMLVPLTFGWNFFNISSTTTTAALLVGIATLLCQRALATQFTDRMAWTIRLGLLVGAASCLKNSNLAIVAFLSVCSLTTLASLERSPRAIFDAAGAALVGVLVLLPWMFWQWKIFGSALYPVFGRGYHISAYTAINNVPLTPTARHAMLTTMIAMAIPWSLTLAALILRPFRVAADSRLLWILFALASSALLSIPILFKATETAFAFRYNVPIKCVVLIVALAAAWRITSSSSKRHLRLAGPAILALILAATARDWTRFYTKDLPLQLYTGLVPKGAQWTPLAQSARAAQDAVPPAQPMLVYMSMPPGLDFSRNPIFVVDWPSEVSPPPGMPLRGGIQPLEAYLLRRKIKYVAYSYLTEANCSRKIGTQYLQGGDGEFMRRVCENAYLFQDLLMELAVTRRKIFDNGVDFVIELGSPDIQEK